MSIKSPHELPLEESTKVPVEWLILDRENPRLPGAFTNDEQIIDYLFKAEELQELLQSIASNGYLDIEPVVVILTDDKAGLIVLEGNRRLAAVRLFLDPSLAERLRLPLPPLANKGFLETMKRVTVYRVKDRAAARAFIGFKHINGPAKWESFAKARFAASWYREGVSLQEISERIGDRHDTIKRMVAAIYVLDQAQDQRVYDLSDRSSARFNFSHLYTALSRSQYVDYLGLPAAWSRSDPQPNPVPAEKLEALGEVLSWMFGSKGDDQPAVVHSQNPDIKRLGAVLAKREAIHILRQTGDLDTAYKSTEPADTKFAAALVRGREAVREAVTNLRGFDGRDYSLVEIAEDISENADTLYDRMLKKWQGSKDKPDEESTG